MTELITIVEAAKLLELTRVRVWQLVRDKEIPAHKVGRMWVIKPNDLTSYIIKRKKSAK